MHTFHGSIGFLVSVFLLLCNTLQANWSTPTNLSETLYDATTPQVAMDPAGNAVAVWVFNNGTTNIIQASVFYHNSNTWTPTMDLPNATSSASSPQVAVDAAGNAVAVWTVYNGSTNVIRAATLPFGSLTWTPASADLSTPGLFSEQPQVAINSAGYAVAVWIEHNGPDAFVNAATLSSGSSTWTTASAYLSASGQTAQFPQVSVNPAGNAVAVWYDGNANVVEGSTLHYSSNTWMATAHLSNAGFSATGPRVGVDNSGNAIAVWILNIGGSGGNVIQAATLPFDSLTWVPATAYLSAIGHNVGAPQLAVDPAGNAVAVWTLANDDYNGFIQGATLAAGSNTWVPTTNPSILVQEVNSPLVRVDALGNATAIWYLLDPIENEIVQAANLPFGSSVWSATTNVSTSSVAYSTTGLAVNPAGNAVAVWSYTTFNSIIQASVNFIPSAPSHFQGKVKKNKFLTQTDLTNILSWNPSSDPTVVGYRIYEGNLLVGETPAAGPYTITLHNRHKKPYTYTLVSVNATGGESYPLTLTLP